MIYMTKKPDPKLGVVNETKITPAPVKKEEPAPLGVLPPDSTTVVRVTPQAQSRGSQTWPPVPAASSGENIPPLKAAEPPAPLAPVQTSDKDRITPAPIKKNDVRITPAPVRNEVLIVPNFKKEEPKLGIDTTPKPIVVSVQKQLQERVPGANNAARDAKSTAETLKPVPAPITPPEAPPGPPPEPPRTPPKEVDLTKLRISRMGTGVEFKLSILVTTLSSRAPLLGELLGKLRRQLMPNVEVVVFEDNKEFSVGWKRNKLIDEARGEFICFVDDDDDIADDYVLQIMTAIEKHPNIDCIGFRGLLSIAGRGSHQVHYSLENQGQVESGGTYYRLPGHLTPLRKAAIARCRFPDQSFGEDADFSAQLMRTKCLKSEAFVDKVLYHYQFNASTSETHGNKGPGAIMGVDRSIFHIIILSQQADNLRGCLDSILKNEPSLSRDRIVVVDDGARQDCEKEYKGITWLQGQKPFIFARNANIGIKYAPNDIILLNDDARLETKYGFTSLGFATKAREEIGIASAAIRGFVGNPNQKPWSIAAGMRKEPRNVAFVCVYIPRDTVNRVGLLDEQFKFYGYEDNDFCHRIKLNDLFLMIYDGCVVEHNSTENKSTYRVRADIPYLMEANRKIFEAKWPDLKLGPPPGSAV